MTLVCTQCNRARTVGATFCLFPLFGRCFPGACEPRFPPAGSGPLRRASLTRAKFKCFPARKKDDDVRPPGTRQHRTPHAGRRRTAAAPTGTQRAPLARRAAERTRSHRGANPRRRLGSAATPRLRSEAIYCAAQGTTAGARIRCCPSRNCFLSEATTSWAAYRRADDGAGLTCARAFPRP